MILEIFPSGPFETNAILLACSKTREAALIDAPEGTTPWLLERLSQLSLSLRMILLTHSHQDHIAEAADLKERFGLPVFVHQEDAANLENPGSDGLPLVLAVKAMHPDGYLSDGQILTVGSLSLQVIHTPGHSPGGVCFYLEKEKTLISGDTLFKGTIGNISFPTSKPSQMWQSLKRLAQLPSDTRVIPGHGDETTIGKESWMAHAENKFG